MMIRPSFERLPERLLLAAILACVIALSGSPCAAEIPLADDLAATGKLAREQRVPVLLFFMQKTCPYCAVARRDFLEPMQKSAAWGGRVIMLEVDVDSHGRLRDFESRATTHREFARSHQVQRVPTIIVFDDRGARAAPPIVGLLGDDFYRLYIEQAIEEGLIKQRRR